MLREIGSDLPTFKTLRFKPGFNLLLADKMKTSNKRDTRNGVGKTSVVEIVNFLFGSRPSKLFKYKELNNYFFYTKFDYTNEFLSVQRACDTPTQVLINDNEIKDLEDWKDELGYLFFQLKSSDDRKFQPTFRMLFPYFVRNDNQHGFEKTTRFSSDQPSWNEQVSLSYLLGLDWRISAEFQETRVESKSISNLKKILQSGDIKQFPEKSLTKLKSQITSLQNELNKLQKGIENFRVVPQYQELRKEADTLTETINQLNLADVADQELLTQLQKSIEEEQPVPHQDILRLYQEAKIIFPDTVKKRFEDVENFHQGIIANRQNHLRSEIQAIEKRIEERKENVEVNDGRRQEIMKTLQTGGALEQYIMLQKDLNVKQAKIASLQQQYDLFKKIERNKDNLLIRKTELKQALINNITERDKIIGDAIISFQNLSKKLYNKPGHLMIEPTENGLKFDVCIESAESKGIKNMQTFCFDMMLTEIGLKNNRHPGFLIHDSHIFDGVDKRQIAKALQIGAQLSEEWGFQYIVTLNSDSLPKDEFDKDFDINPYIMDVKLTDAENGGLFGMRFKDSD